MTPRRPGSFPARSSSFEREFGLLHRQHGEPDEAIGILAMRRRAGVIVGLGELEPERRRRPIDHRSHEREHLRIDAGLVHGFDAAFEIDVVRAEHRADASGIERDAAAVVAPDAGAGGFSFVLHELHPLRGVPVGVRVDHTPLGLTGCVDAAEHDSAARCRGSDQEIALGHRHGWPPCRLFCLMAAPTRRPRIILRAKSERNTCDAPRACQATQICLYRTRRLFAS